jgi:hypothetical protein
MKLASPELNEQDLALIATALDALVKRDGLNACVPVSQLLAKLDASVRDEKEDDANAV